MLLRIYCETNEGAQWAWEVLARHLCPDVHHCGIHVEGDTVTVKLPTTATRPVWQCHDSPAQWLQEHLLNCQSVYVPLLKHIDVEGPQLVKCPNCDNTVHSDDCSDVDGFLGCVNCLW